MRSLAEVLNSLPAYGCSDRIKLDWWLGGGCFTQPFTDLLEADGFNSLGGWVENAAWFERYGITREEYDLICNSGG